ncbi:MAG TPA: hypothetical protein VGF25_11250 [Thermoleophilaceae bacterium]
MRVRLAIGLGFAVVAVGLLISLGRSDQRLAGTNAQVQVSGNAVPVAAGRVLCQPEGIPADTAEVRVYVGTPARVAGPLDVTFRKGGRVLATGTLRELRDGVPATASMSPRIANEVPGAKVCFHNRGRSRIYLAGDRTPVRGSGANPYGTVFDDEPRVDYLRPGRESWLALAGTIAHRFGLEKTSFFGPWTMWVVFGLIGCTWLAAVLLLLRRLPAR